MKFAIGAIFKNEYEYVLEWLAWHRLAGFSKFFIADNGSIDGTRQLLEALSEAGFIKIIYTPPQPNAQLSAYQTILNDFYNQTDAIAFIDADEFIYADDGILPTQHLATIFADPKVAAVLLNWRMFGSSYKQTKEEGLVIERFLRCGDDNEPFHHRHKSIVRPILVNQAHPHHCTIPDNFRYVNCHQKDAVFLLGQFGQAGLSDRPIGASELSPGPLRVNHYAVKSLQEFNDEKFNRGNVMAGPGCTPPDNYFQKRDINDIEFLGPSRLAVSVREEMALIQAELSKNSRFYQQGFGVIDCCDANAISGWVFLEKNEATTAKVMIFINGTLYAKVAAFHYRDDLVRSGICVTGHCGFHYNFIPPLQPGDIVEASVYANPFKFHNNQVIIS